MASQEGDQDTRKGLLDDPEERRVFYGALDSFR